MKGKKEFKDTSFGKFVNKAISVAPELVNVGASLMTGNYIGAVKEAGKILKKKAETDQEAKLLLQEFERFEMTYEKECFELESKDRKDARKLYISDSIIQKTLAIVFTVAYFYLCKYLLDHFFKGVELEDYQLAFISSMFGAMSTKVNTIIDFFFGGSVK